MAIVNRPQNWQRAIVTLSGVLVFAVIVCALYWARTVFIPIALAIFLAFVLTPLVRQLEKFKLNRLLSVFVVLAFTAALFAAAGFALFKQGRDMAHELPGYTENIKAKINYLSEFGKGSKLTEQMRQMFEEISESWQTKGSQAETKEAVPPTDEKGTQAETKKPVPPTDEPEIPTGRGSKPMRVVIEPEGNAWLSRFSPYLESVLGSLGEAAFAAVLVIFMLCKREDLRNRFLWLVGHGHLTTTTRAVDDVVQRLSRYLFAQFTINLSYGLLLSLGLWMIGVNHAFLWGALGGTLRYVPYIGAPTAGLFPVALSMVQFPGWIQPLSVIGLIVILEIVTANVVEPIFFGHSMGVSEVTLLISAAIWTYLWGPIGLVLAMPITVCLTVIGEYVPGLEFVGVLLGDRPALKPHISLYQRLTAHDQDEATHIAEKYVEESPKDSLCDGLLIPVLRQARQEALRDILSDRDLDFVLQTTREISEEVTPEPTKELNSDVPKTESQSEESAAGLGTRVRILGLSARDEFDRVVLEMLGRVLNTDKWDLEIAPSSLLASEVMPYVAEHEPAIICVSCLRPGGLAHTRYLCKRLRAQFPDKHIMIGSWGQEPDEKEDLDALMAAGADQIVETVVGVRDRLNTWRPVLSTEQDAQHESAEETKLLQSV